MSVVQLQRVSASEHPNASTEMLPALRLGIGRRSYERACPGDQSGTCRTAPSEAEVAIKA
jgi:hypothetical protein